jgi:hypothetical protein
VWSEGGTEQWQCAFRSVTRGTIHTAVPWIPLRTVHLRLSQNSRTLHSVTCSLVHRISHNTDDGNGPCGQQFICSRRLSWNDFRQTPIVQFIYKNVSSTKFHQNRPRNVENKDTNSFTLLSNVWVSRALQTRLATWCEYLADLSTPPRRQQPKSGSVSPLNRQ